MSEPVGPQYGLQPLRRYEEGDDDLPPIDSRDIISDHTYIEGSEFGGVPGRIQPAPHIPTASERLQMVYAIDPMDDGTRPDSVLPPELDGEFEPR
jgi:hypothetical protein